jgi:C-terminal processing protease CtpA/Prc
MKMLFTELTSASSDLSVFPGRRLHKKLSFTHHKLIKIFILIFSFSSYASAGIPLTTQEKLLDFNVAVNQFKDYYAPLEYKEKRLGVDYKNLFKKLRSEVRGSKSDHEFYQVLGKLVRIFDDGHVSVSIPGMNRYSLPFTLDYFDGHYVVVNVDKGFSDETGVSFGDQLLSIDGISPDEASAKTLQYTSLGYERANKRLGAFKITHRNYAIPQSRRVYLKFKRYSDGAEYNITTFWSISHGTPKFLGTKKRSHSPPFDMISRSAHAGILEFGGSTPFFYTEEVQNTFGFTKVEASKQQWYAAGGEGSPHNIFALLYRYSGKNILIIRVPTYNIGDVKRAVKTYEVLLKTYAHTADVLVIDQTHNPGGSVKYVEELSRLFLKKPGPSFAFAPRADRAWLRSFSSIWADPGVSELDRTYFENIYFDVDEAQRRGDFLAAPMAISRRTTVITENTAWNKPILLLIDELCGSGGDGFPMIMKGNGVASLFGHRTSGMGGNVDSIGSLPNTGASFKLTRSLFYLSTPDDSIPDRAIIVNNGVEPHIKRDYGIDDFYNRYVEYVRDFSDAAVNLKLSH